VIYTIAVFINIVQVVEIHITVFAAISLSRLQHVVGISS